MNIWSLPPVRQAGERILIQASSLRVAHPEMIPLERLQAARAQCVPEVLEAIVAIEGRGDGSERCLNIHAGDPAERLTPDG